MTKYYRSSDSVRKVVDDIQTLEIRWNSAVGYGINNMKVYFFRLRHFSEISEEEFLIHFKKAMESILESAEEDL